MALKGIDVERKRINSDSPLMSCLDLFELPVLCSVPPILGKPPIKRHFQSASQYENNIYYFGGTDGTTIFNDLIILDILSLKWKRPSASNPFDKLPVPRYGHSSVVIDAKLYIFGGITKDNTTSEETYLNDLWVFDIRKEEWSGVKYSQFSGSPLRRSLDKDRTKARSLKCTRGEGVSTRHYFSPMPRAHHCAVYIPLENSMMILGGEGMDENGTKCTFHDTWMLHIRKLGWKVEKYRGYTGSSLSTAYVIGLKDVLILGGYTIKGKNNKVFCEEVVFLRGETKEISSKKSAIRVYGSASVKINNNILLIGGILKTRFTREYSNRILVYNIRENLWGFQRTEGAVIPSLIGASSTLHNNSIIIYGTPNCKENVSPLNINHNTNNSNTIGSIGSLRGGNGGLLSGSPPNHSSSLNSQSPATQLTCYIIHFKLQNCEISASGNYYELSRSVNNTIAESDIIWGNNIGSGATAILDRGVYNSQDVVLKKFYYNEDKQFWNECKILSQISDHPNIVKFIGSFITSENLPCMVLEFLPFGDLFSFLSSQRAKNATFDLLQVLNNALAITSAVNHLHTKNILHCDIKSLNILLSCRNNTSCYDHLDSLKLIDFGESRTIFQYFEPIQIGTVRYAAPEMLRKETYQAHSDMYSVGVVMWELLTRVFPYDQLTHDYMVEDEILSGKRLEFPDVNSLNWRSKKEQEAQSPIVLKYIEVVKMCWDVPQSRPAAGTLRSLLIDLLGKLVPLISDPEIQSSASSLFTKYIQTVPRNKPKQRQILSTVSKGIKRLSLLDPNLSRVATHNNSNFNTTRKISISKNSGSKIIIISSSSSGSSSGSDGNKVGFDDVDGNNNSGGTTSQTGDIKSSTTATDNGEAPIVEHRERLEHISRHRSNQFQSITSDTAQLITNNSIIDSDPNTIRIYDEFFQQLQVLVSVSPLSEIIKYEEHINSFSSYTNSESGQTLLHVACQRGDLEIFKFVYEFCAYTINFVDAKHQSPLHIASSYAHYSICLLLLENEDILVHVHNVMNETPLELIILRPPPLPTDPNCNYYFKLIRKLTRASLKEITQSLYISDHNSNNNNDNNNMNNNNSENVNTSDSNRELNMNNENNNICKNNNQNSENNNENNVKNDLIASQSKDNNSNGTHSTDTNNINSEVIVANDKSEALSNTMKKQKFVLPEVIDPLHKKIVMEFISNLIHGLSSMGNLSAMKHFIFSIKEIFNKKLNIDFNSPNQWGETPLYIAVNSGLEEVAVYLFLNGADPHIKVRVDDLEITPWDIAVAKDLDIFLDVMALEAKKRNKSQPDKFLNYLSNPAEKNWQATFPTFIQSPGRRRNNLLNAVAKLE